MYSLCESGLDHLESEQLLPTAGLHGAVNPMIAGAFSGLVYKSTGECGPCACREGVACRSVVG
jgi:hypothetical protein